jgi:hypothetical protein
LDSYKKEETCMFAKRMSYNLLEAVPVCVFVWRILCCRPIPSHQKGNLKRKLRGLRRLLKKSTSMVEHSLQKGKMISKS